MAKRILNMTRLAVVVGPFQHNPTSSRKKEHKKVVKPIKFQCGFNKKGETV